MTKIHLKLLRLNLKEKFVKLIRSMLTSYNSIHVQIHVPVDKVKI